MPVSLTNTVDIAANSIGLVQTDGIVDVAEKFGNITGLAPTTLNSLEKLATALNNDANFFQTTTSALGTKASTDYVNTALGTKQDVFTIEKPYSIGHLKTHPQSLTSTHITRMM